MEYWVFWHCVYVFSTMLGSQWSTLCVSRWIPMVLLFSRP